MLLSVDIGGECLVFGTGDIVLPHELLCKYLACLKSGSILYRAKTSPAFAFKLINNSFCQRVFRACYGQVYPVILDKVQERFVIRDVYINTLGNL